MSGTFTASRPRLVPVGAGLAALVVCAGVGALSAEASGTAMLLVVGALVVGVALLAALASVGFASVGGAAMIGAAFVGPWNGVRLAEGAALTDGLLVLAAVMFLAEVVTGRRQLRLAREVRTVVLGLGAIALGGVLGTIAASADGSTSLVYVARFGIAAAGTVVLVTLWNPTVVQARLALAAWVAGSALNAIAGAFVTFTITGRALGWSTHPNHLGLACMLGSAVALAELLSVRRRSLLPVWLVLLGANIYGVIASGSRAALLGGGVALCFVTWRLAAPAVAIVASSAVAAAIALVATGVVDPGSESSVGRLVGTQSSRESDSDRLVVLRETFERGADSPIFGTGFDLALQGHNIYLQLWSSAGLLGIAGLVAVVAGLGRVLLGAARAEHGDPAARILAVGVLGGGIGYLVASIFQNILWDRYLWVYLGLGLSSAVAADRRSAATGATVA
jgi:hypothetical protein